MSNVFDDQFVDRTSQAYLELIGQPEFSAAVGITVSASPFAYTSVRKGQVIVQAGTVSAITLTRLGTAYNIGVTAGVCGVLKHDILTVTYTGTPTMTFVPL